LKVFQNTSSAVIVGNIQSPEKKKQVKGTMSAGAGTKEAATLPSNRYIFSPVHNRLLSKA
jgi:hypothetical protein